ncbi:MAG: DUF1801 domain-containing protein [Flavobacterium sp.]|nr:DUF1801 domain-containing protein [Flavobacterium sp.]
MQSTEITVEGYLASLPDDRKTAMKQLRSIISQNLPVGFQEEMSYGMIGYVVPHSLYPKGYHCNAKLPLPFLNIASQKNFIALYHMGMYADQSVLNWFTDEYPKTAKGKLDMGKSCVRFKKMDDIPFELIGKLVTKFSVEQWISCYENAFVNSKNK